MGHITHATSAPDGKVQAAVDAHVAAAAATADHLAAGSGYRTQALWVLVGQPAKPITATTAEVA